jgi:hypothetical protein
MLKKNVAKFKYLAMTVKNQNLNQLEMNSRLKSENACYHLVHILLTAHLPLKNEKIYKIIILPILYRCEISPPTLREEHRLRVFENKVLWIIFGSKR